MADGEFAPTSNVSTSTFDMVYGVNVRGLFFCLREQLLVMKQQKPLVTLPGRPAARGSIVNMASAAGHIAIPGCTSYVSSKHAVIGLTKTAGMNLAHIEHLAE